MAKLSKKMAVAIKKVDSEKLYDLQEAMKLVKVNLTKFDSSVDLHITWCRSRKADQAIQYRKPPSRNGKDQKY
jgi:large subunit ribosomal protein L1